MPKVSIVTPCYNADRFVERTVGSVSAQTLDDWQLVVVDDGSTDDSAERVGHLAALDPRITLLRQANAGMRPARIAGYRAAAPSEYLLFLDADDVIAPTMLAELVKRLDATPDASVAYCAFSVIDGADRPVDPGPTESWLRSVRSVPTRFGVRELPAHVAETPFEALMADPVPLPSSWVIRQSSYDRTTGWDPDPANDDRDLMLQLALVGRVIHVALPLLLYRRHGDNLSMQADVWQWIRTVTDKWWRGEHLTSPADRRRARRAILFTRRIGCVVAVREALAAARHRRLREALSPARLAARRYVALGLGYAGLRVPR